MIPDNVPLGLDSSDLLFDNEMYTIEVGTGAQSAVSVNMVTTFLSTFTTRDQTPPQFHLIDLARTFRPRWRRFRWLVKDLSQLDVSARQIGGSRSDRLRFLLAYLGLQSCTPRARRLIQRTIAKSDRILRRIARKGA